MGCDIHAFVEELRDPKTCWWVNRAKVFVWRDYAMFGALAGVRVDDIEYVEPRGLPDKPDFDVQEHAEKWKDDGHSWSWLNAEEVRQAYERYIAYCEAHGWTFNDRNRRQFLAIVAFMTELAGDDPTTCRLTFWFDN